MSRKYLPKKKKIDSINHLFSLRSTFFFFVEFSNVILVTMNKGGKFHTRILIYEMLLSSNRITYVIESWWAKVG